MDVLIKELREIHKEKESKKKINRICNYDR